MGELELPSAAGLYPAPDGAPYRRWWDGRRWTVATQPLGQMGVPQPRMSVTHVPQRTSHPFRLIMTLLTGGLWAPFVWLPVTIINRMSSRRVVTRHI